MATKKYNSSEFPQILDLRLDKALSAFDEIRTRSRAENLLDRQLVLVNGLVEKPSYRIKGHEVIEIQFPEPEPPQQSKGPEDFPCPLDILFEDDDLLVVNKPSGMVVHPGAGNPSATLVDLLLAHTPNLSMKFNETRPGIVHRIDKDTSGLLVVAKNDLAHEGLAIQFKEKTAHRLYEAIVWGQFKPSEGTVRSYLSRHPVHRKRFASIRNLRTRQIERTPQLSPPPGKWAVSNYTSQTEAGPLSLVEFKLETGRTHQIRVHASEMNHPIVGDQTYGSNKYLTRLKNGDLKNEISQLERFLLHARELGFTHPITQGKLRFSVEWPPEDLFRNQRWGLSKRI